MGSQSQELWGLGSDPCPEKALDPPVTFINNL